VFAFVVEIVAVAIVAELLAAGLKLIPRYAKRKHAFLFQALDTGFLTVVFGLLIHFEIYPSWAPLLIIVLLVLWLSVWCTNQIVKRGDEPAAGGQGDA